MSIAAICPSCSSRLTAPDEAAGKRVKCPKCKVAMTIPTPEPLPIEEHEQSRAKYRPSRSVFLGAVLVAALLLCGVLVYRFFSRSETSSAGSASQFNPASVRETAQWAGLILKPLDATAKIQNGVVRNDAIKNEIARIKATTDCWWGRRCHGRWNARSLIGR